MAYQVKLKPVVFNLPYGKAIAEDYSILQSRDYVTTPLEPVLTHISNSV